MTRDQLSAILLSAPDWMRTGLTATNTHLRERAADALAATILDRLATERAETDRNQLALPM